MSGLKKAYHSCPALNTMWFILGDGVKYKPHWVKARPVYTTLQKKGLAPA